MRSASTSSVSSPSELSRLAQEKAIQGQPVVAGRVAEEPVLEGAQVARVMARPIMGQQAAAPASDRTTISRNEAGLIRDGLNETMAGDVVVATPEATALRDRLVRFMAGTGTSFEITKAEVDLAEKILDRSNAARKPNTSAYIALGVIVAAAAIYFTIVGSE